MLISLHLPKTAGSSFKRSLSGHFDSSLLCDYKDAPLNDSPFLRKSKAFLACNNNKLSHNKFDNYQCIHGHFLPFKYAYFSKNLEESVYFITWMREPVDRLISHYYYWMSSYKPEKSFKLHKKVFEEKWTLEKFCFSDEMRNVYSQFLWKFPLEKFQFIGITEFYEDDLTYFFNNFLSSDTLAYNELVNKKNKKNISDELRMKIEKFHAKDVDIYKKALDIRLKRIYNEKK